MAVYNRREAKSHFGINKDGIQAAKDVIQLEKDGIKAAKDNTVLGSKRQHLDSKKWHLDSKNGTLAAKDCIQLEKDGLQAEKMAFEHKNSVRKKKKDSKILAIEKKETKNGTEEENDLRGEGRYRWRRKKNFYERKSCRCYTVNTLSRLIGSV